MGQMVVRFAGEGSGVAGLSWGQLEILGAMKRQRAWLALSHCEPLPAGTTLDDVAGWLRYLMGRHQVLRTRLRFPTGGPAVQEVHASGETTVDVVEAGDEDPSDVADRMAYRYAARDFDFAGDWPIFLAAILKDGVPAYRVLTVCHVVWDAFGALAVLADLRERDALGGAPPKPVTAMQPLEQARWQHSPAGRRHSEAVLRQWADVLRRVPARRFPAPVDRGEPRHWKLRFDSPAAHLAIQVIRGRTRAGTAQVILTTFLVALARVTGIHPPVTRIAVNNRFRRGLADSVSVTTQYGLCAVDVAGVSFDEALARVSRRVIATFKNSYYDPVELAALVDRISRERGEEVDIDCYYNDRRLTEVDEPVAEPPAPADVRAALPATTFTHEPLTRRGSERLFAAVEEAPGSFHLTLEADTWYMPREAMVDCAHAMEETAVAAVLTPAPLSLSESGGFNP
ncbi:condensation domain-containing protein [Phytohabitans sp. LJ34]|uniref:condensation domain-containing protein n=1 Tax=Phytohabitans sp. LJ34 TaxID=3452217 RepID=UPI003F8A7005